MKFKSFLLSTSLDFTIQESVIFQLLGSLNESEKIDSMISQMKTIFSGMDKIDPTSPKVLKMRELLKKLDEPSLNKIIDADIKFLKIMAQTELRNRK
jgi:hypothetical protein